MYPRHLPMPSARVIRPRRLPAIRPRRPSGLARLHPAPREHRAGNVMPCNFSTAPAALVQAPPVPPPPNLPRTQKMCQKYEQRESCPNTILLTCNTCDVIAQFKAKGAWGQGSCRVCRACNEGWYGAPTVSREAHRFHSLLCYSCRHGEPLPQPPQISLADQLPQMAIADQKHTPPIMDLEINKTSTNQTNH